MNRRGFLKFVGLGAAAGVGVALLPSLPLVSQPAAVQVYGAEVVYAGSEAQLTIPNLWYEQLTKAYLRQLQYPNLVNRSYTGEIKKRRHISTNFKDWDSRQTAKGSFAKWNQRMLDLKPPST